jgi:hypothetical protein
MWYFLTLKLLVNVVTSLLSWVNLRVTEFNIFHYFRIVTQFGMWERSGTEVTGKGMNVGFTEVSSAHVWIRFGFLLGGPLSESNCSMKQIIHLNLGLR